MSLDGLLTSVDSGRDYLMEDGFAAFERLATTAELRSVFVVESLDKNLEVALRSKPLQTCRLIATLSSFWKYFQFSAEDGQRICLDLCSKVCGG